MKKKIVLLTNETVHHHHFIKKIVSKKINLSILLETKKIKKNYQVKHKIDSLMQNYEKKKWFNNKYKQIKKNYKVKEFKDFNSPKCINEIKKIKPDIIISFGSGYLKKNFLNNFRNKIFNFHGGEPSLYRGLDSHLWAIYHNDFRNLNVVFHKVDGSLDTGAIVYKKNISFKKLNNLSKLRYLNTEICIQLFHNFLKNYKKFKSIKQNKVGRYYSSMPSVLKSEVFKKFKKKLKNS
tara:strand:+ start:89 stop:796 length:708 start_codon:yes stop_codon:yes gene_type:complete